MANYATLKAAIQQVVKTNGNNEITGALLQQSLLAMIDSLGANYEYAGIATVSTNPGTPDQNVFYIASTAGTYSNFNGIVVNDGEVAILKYNGSWVKDSTGLAPASLLMDLFYKFSDTIAVQKGYRNTNNATNYGGITTSETIYSAHIAVQEGDSFYIFGKGGTSNYYRLWAFYDAEGNRINRYTGSGTYRTTPYKLDIPAGVSFVNINLVDYDSTTDRILKATSFDKINEEFTNRVGLLYDINNAMYVIRAATSSTSTSDNPNGTRIRIIFQVTAGWKLWAKCTDPGGVFVDVYDTLNHAIAASAGALQPGVGYTNDFIEYPILYDGFLSISLTNGTTAISDARKQEMLNSLAFAIGTEISYLASHADGLAKDNVVRIAALEHPVKPRAYYGEKINLEGGFDWYVYDDEAAGGQSGARFGDYLFIVQDLLAKVICYNLRTKKKLYTLTTGISSQSFWHCNQSSFGKYYYDESDMFPLLYISQQNDANGQCSAMGFRIVPTLTDGEISSFAITLVQTIKFPVMTDTNCMGNVNAAFDLQAEYLWGYCRNNNAEAANYRQAHFARFNIPALRDGSNNIISVVELTDADILESFSDDWSMLNAQGGFIRNGKLVIVQGYPSAGYIWCRIIDLYLAKKQTSLIDLYRNGMPYEPEGAFFYDGKIMTNTSGTRIVAIEFV